LRFVTLQLRSIWTRQFAPSITPVSSNTCWFEKKGQSCMGKCIT
jgi:hypothetical protein